MTRLLLLAHAPLASALQAVAQHVFPDCAPSTWAMDVPPDASPEQIEAGLREHLARAAGEDVLILVDTFGATPCNAALRVADGQGVRVVAGVNVPMLWRTLCYRDEPIDRLIDRAVAGATQGVMHVAVPRRQNQPSTATPSPHDQVDHRHQQ